MGAGSSAEPPGPAAAEPRRGAAEPPPAPEPPAEPAKVLDANLPVSDVSEDNLELDVPLQEPHQPEGVATHQELNGEQPEGVSPLQEPPGLQAEAVGQTEQSSAALQEEAITMEASPSDSSTKDGVDDEKEDPHISKHLPSLEEDAEDLDQASEPQSYDLGFKKVFKFVGFRFTVKKEKTGKSEPVQLLTVKKEVEGTEGTGDQSEVSPEEIPVPEDALSAEDNTKDATKNENPEDESPKTPEAKELCSQSAALATDTASPLRKFFSQGWTGFRKKKSFRKPKEDELQSAKKEEDQEEEEAVLTAEAAEKEEKSEDKSEDQEKNVTAVTIETHEKEQTEDEKQKLKKTVAAITVEASKKEELTKHDRQGDNEVIGAAVVKGSVKEEKAEDKERKLVERSEDLGKKEEKTEGEKGSEVTEITCTTDPIFSGITESASAGLKTSPEVLSVEEKLESTEKCEIDDTTKMASGEKLEAASAGLLALESTGEELKKSEGRAGSKPESLAPLKEETFDEKTQKSEPIISPAIEDLIGKLETPGEAHETTMEKKASKAHETKLTLGAPGIKSSSTSEHSFDTEDDQQSARPTDEGLQGQTGIAMTDDIKPTEITTEITSDEAVERRPPEGITSEAELLSSQEKTKLQGSPLKKLFTGTGLKKLSGKKHKGRREESKLGEQGEQIQHLSDSPDSPEEQKAESSASSPEELNEIPSLEKSADGMQVTESEDAAISDVERKRESVTPWASFKKMVTPKKRVRRPSESDKEEEIDRTKSAAVSTTENAVDENQGELKENGMDQKQEKVTEEPKRKVDTSVSWEAFICVGSSKKRARKSSSSDEEAEHKLGQEGQRIEESGQSKETATDTVLTSSQESDQGQGNSSPEQAGSPSEGEGISTWESFKRLVTPRRKSKTRMEERTEDSVMGSSLEHSTSDGEPGKDESWVPFRKLMPGRRKKKSDGKPEPALLKQAREDMAETTEEDSDVPAVVPLSEYEAAEQEKIEAQQAKDAEAIREQTSEKERAEKLEEALRTEQASDGLVHAVSVTVVEGERAVTSIEERSPSWISAAVTECIEQSKEEEEKETKKTFESEAVVEEAVVFAKTVPEMRKDKSDDTTASEQELTSEAVTALEETTEAYCAEETMEVSFAEETTEMVSAVSRLSETPDTTEEVTPVQEVEATEQNLRELERQTQEVLQEVAERVRSSDVAQLVNERTMTATVIETVQEIESDMKDDATDVKVVGQETLLLEQSLKTEGHKEDDIQALGSARSIQGINGSEGGVLHEGSERSEIPAAMKENAGGLKNVAILRDEGQWQKHEEAVVEDLEEAPELQRTAEELPSKDKDFHCSKMVTSKEEPILKQESSDQGKLPLTELAEDEMRDEHIPEVETAVQNMDEGQASALGPAGIAGTATEVPVQLEGERDTTSKGPEHTEAVVVADPGTPEGEEATPALGSPDQAWAKGVAGEAPPQGEEGESGLSAVKNTQVPTAELPMQKGIRVSAVTPETTGSEAAAASGQSVGEEACVQIPAEASGPILEPKCLERTPREALSQSDETEGSQLQDAVLKTAALSQSENTEGNKMEEAILSVDSPGPVTAAPTQLEGENLSALASTGIDTMFNGSSVLPGSSPKKCKTQSSVAAEEPVEAEQELVENSSCEDVLREETEGERLVETAQGAGDSGPLEAVSGDGCSSHAVQEEVLRVPEEGPGSAFPRAEGSEAPEVSVPVPAAALEEPVAAETVTLAHTAAKTLEPLGARCGQMSPEEVPGATVDYSGTDAAEPDSAEAPQPQAPPASVKAVPEKKQEMAQGFGHPEQSVALLKKSPSLAHPQLEKDTVQSVTLESQSTKIVLNAILTAVDKLTETEEAAVSESEQHTKSIGESQPESSIPEFLETMQGDHHLPVKEEEIPSREQEPQQSGTGKHATLAESAEIHASVEQAKVMVFISHAPKEGKSENSLEIVISPQDVSRESPRLLKSAVGVGTSEDSTKEPLDTHPPKLKEKEVGQILEISDHNTSQQTQMEKKDEQHHLSVEDVKTQTPEDVCSHEGAPCHHPQSLNSLAPEASNMC
ncbi:A-kinase anchor protein 12 isoform X2 [Dromaius novaehollandiae]|uniref:A-kinase anchor protein 12 isoform X2 n=1 Tax=Dromaius novaehollandiae TaxID=8790 RepID=UPI00312013CC